MEETIPMDKSQCRIFISYRRKGGIDTARWLHDQLKSRGYQVFIDLEGLRAGAFNQALYQEIKNSDVFLIVLSKGCLNRCKNKNDWVRREIAQAIQCRLNVIPIMKEDFRFPASLPEDIALLPSYQALEISYVFFDAFMEKLESYIACAPVPMTIPSLKKKKKSIMQKAVGYLVAAALVIAAFFAGKFLGDFISELRDPAADTSPPAQTAGSPQDTTVAEDTEPPSTTDAPVISVPDESGTSLSNLCNGGIISIGENYSISWIKSPDAQWYNRLKEDDSWYFYDAKQRFIATGWTEGETTQRKRLLQDVDCQYLYVTSQWLYCVLEQDGVSTLYRAENDLDNHTIGQLQPIVENVLARNQIAIRDGYIYYWVRGEGLFKCRTDGSDRELLFDNGGSSSLYGLVTFHVSDEYVYFWVSTGGIYAVSVNGSLATHLVNTKDLDAVPTHAIECGGKFYYVLDYVTNGVRTAPEEIWCANIDGSGNRLVATLETPDMEIRMINAGVSTLYMRIVSGGGVSMYSFSLNSGELKMVSDLS